MILRRNVKQREAESRAGRALVGWARPPLGDPAFASGRDVVSCREVLRVEGQREARRAPMKETAVRVLPPRREDKQLPLPLPLLAFATLVGLCLRSTTPPFA